MPSCSNSSNIQSSFNALSVVQGGSRLLADVTRVSGLTIGNVIRYDVISGGYTASKADDAPNSEVFGVIESYDAPSNKFSVVIYGSINLSSSSLISIDGSTGGSGGNDIYFLSGSTAGLLQNLAPTNLNHIIKPVYQAAPHGSFSGVVVNYLGYKIGGEIQSVFEDGELGNIQIIVGNNDFGNGYVDASYSQALPITDFSEFYAKFETQYGYIEMIQFNDSLPGGIEVGNVATQPTSQYTGTITYVDPGNKIIYFYKSPNTDLVSLNKNLIITTNTTSVTIPSTSLSSTKIYSVYSPKITLAEPLVISGKSGTEIVSQQQKVGIKVKPQGVTVTVPRSVTVTGLTASNITLGITWSDVGNTLNDHETRILALEARIR